MNAPITFNVIHNTEAHAFECWVQGQRCFAEYEPVGRVMRMTHTVVPGSLQGRGIAAKLVEAALNHAQAQGLEVEPVCSYVRAHLSRHPRP